MKIAPIMDALRARPSVFEPRLIHTGQHYDEALSKVFFEDLGIPRPDENLQVGSGSHARQTAEVMIRFEESIQDNRPDGLIVVGDVNSTIACSIVASKLGVRVFHVEAGLRSFDRTMPEEINRLLTDSISDHLFVSEPSGVENLRNEGIPDERMTFAGNVMIDTLLKHRAKADESDVLTTLDLDSKNYAVLTLHRPSNVDDRDTFSRILQAVREIAQRLTVVMPVHPRTRARLAALGLDVELDAIDGLRCVDPLGYLDFLKLQADARLVLTDSGGVQEETTILKVPCLTIRENTERPITITAGTNTLVGTDADRIVAEALRVLDGNYAVPQSAPENWDGGAAERVADKLAELDY